jgi:predicted ATPase
MIDSAKHDHGTTRLDPKLLSTRFRVQTNWHVITGAPCCGKTTLIVQLADKGFQTIAETAREYFEDELAKGRTLEEIRSDDVALQCQLMDVQLRLERELRASDVLFLDRGLPDCLAFCRVFGMDPNERLAECFRHRYASVFVLDRLPVRRSATLGPEDEATARFLDEWHPRDYAALGYDVVRVPPLSPEERLAFVLKSLAEQGLI